MSHERVGVLAAIVSTFFLAAVGLDLVQIGKAVPPFLGACRFVGQAYICHGLQDWLLYCLVVMMPLGFWWLYQLYRYGVRKGVIIPRGSKEGGV